MTRDAENEPPNIARIETVTGKTDRTTLFPWSDGTARTLDPTRGNIDLDLQWDAWDTVVTRRRIPELGQLHSVQMTLQARRDQAKPRTVSPPPTSWAARFLYNENQATNRLGTVVGIAAVVVAGVAFALLVTFLHSLGIIR